MLDWTIVVPRHAMSAFLKTLFGDPGTIAIVAIVMTSERLLVASGRVS